MKLKGSWLRYTAAPLVVWTGLKSCWSLYHWLTADGGSLWKHSCITSVVSLLSVRVWLMREVEVLRGSAVSWWSREVEAAPSAGGWRGSDWAERRASSSSDWWTISSTGDDCQCCSLNCSEISSTDQLHCHIQLFVLGLVVQLTAPPTATWI